jgi:DNA-binding transcriptional regulator YdaS (Cro superfamily)
MVAAMKKYRGQVKQLAQACGCTPEHMSYVLNGHRKPSPKLCMLIEKETDGMLTRYDLRPDIYLQHINRKPSRARRGKGL